MAHRRCGLTRLELLVAGGIAVLLAGFLLPAVQKLRAASDRTRCTNNLRGLGTGFIAYHQAKHHLPPGGDEASPIPSAGVLLSGRERAWSWAYHLLPFIGHADNFSNPNDDAVRAALVPIFYCPARRAPALWNNRAMLDYAANAGSKANGSDGAIQRTSEPPLRFDEFTDGLASTVLLAEKRLNVAEFGSAPGDRLGFAAPGWSAACEAHRYGSEPPAADVNVPGDLAIYSEAGSSHRGIFLALFADGTIRTIRLTVNPDVWRRASIRNDSLNFNFNDL
jgi:hypothetical protein